MSAPLDAADRITYRLEQSFSYAYDAPIEALRHRLRVVPPEQHGPARLTSARLEVDGADVRRRRWRDASGNTVLRLNADRVDAYVRFAFSATVTHDPASGPVLMGLGEMLSPRHLRSTRLTASSPALAELAAGAARPVPVDVGSMRSASLDLADALCQVSYDALEYEWGVTGVHTTASEALAGGRGVCQDSAHIMLAVCRLRGLPARYVSGHLVGQGGTHAWVEVLVPSADGRAAEAVGFDPCNGRRTGAGYLTVATGRDYLDAAPTSGSYVGVARGELTTTRDVVVLDAA